MTMIIGIDCATQHQKTGLARARLEDRGVTIEAWELASANRPPETIIAEWLTGTQTALLALDASLGWPEKLGVTLVEYSAGNWIESKADDLFHHATDRDVKHRLGKRPLEVGADRIAPPRGERWSYCTTCGKRPAWIFRSPGSLVRLRVCRRSKFIQPRLFWHAKPGSRRSGSALVIWEKT